MGPGMGDRTACLEEQGLEERVGDEMKDRADPSTDRQAENHVAELRHRGIGKDLLDVGLHEGQPRSRHDRDGADPRTEVHSSGIDREALPEHAVETGEQIDAGDDHRGGVDQRRRRRGAGHGVGKPGVERELRRLAHHAEEQRHRGHDERGLVDPPVERLLVDGGHVEGVAGGKEQDDNADEQADVAHAGGQERLEGSVGVRLVLPPVTDEEEGAQTHQFPADQQTESGRGLDHPEHRSAEEVQCGEVVGVALVTAKVFDREHVDAQRDEGDREEHGDGESVDMDTKADIDAAIAEPGDASLDRIAELDRLFAGEVGGERTHAGTHRSQCLFLRTLFSVGTRSEPDPLDHAADGQDHGGHGADDAELGAEKLHPLAQEQGGDERRHHQCRKHPGVGEDPRS